MEKPDIKAFARLINGREIPNCPYANFSLIKNGKFDSIGMIVDINQIIQRDPR